MPIGQDQLIRLLIADRSKVLAYIRSIVRSEHLAEDVFQDVSMLAIRKQDEIADEMHFMKWVRKASRFEALNVLRRTRSREMSLDDQMLDDLESHWQHYDDESGTRVSEALDKCLAALPPGAQRIIRERYESGRSVTELAKLMGRRLDSLYVAISRIYRALSDCLLRRLGPQHG